MLEMLISCSKNNCFFINNATIDTMNTENKESFKEAPWSHGCIFKDLESGEIPLYVIRKHWLVILEPVIGVLFFCGIFFLILWWGNFANVYPILSWLTALWSTMIGIQYVYARWLNNELDVLIVTNKKIIEYDQIKFLSRKISQASLDQVQEVRASTSGIIGNIFRFGNLTIHTAGEASDFMLTTIPDSLETSRIVHWLIDAYRHNLWDKK